MGNFPSVNYRVLAKDLPITESAMAHLKKFTEKLRELKQIIEKDSATYNWTSAKKAENIAGIAAIPAIKQRFDANPITGVDQICHNYNYIIDDAENKPKQQAIRQKLIDIKQIIGDYVVMARYFGQ